MHGPQANGRPGASARAEYERRQRRDADRRRARFGRLAPLVDLLVGPRASTVAWARGAEGEERVGLLLDEAIAETGAGIVLHDRRVPGRRLNLDHLVVTASAVWVIDTKHYHGRLARRPAGGWFVARDVLMVGRRDESRLVTAARHQRALVEHVVGDDAPVRVALCFTGVERTPFVRPFVMDEVLVTWPTALVRSLRGSTMPTLLTGETRTDLAARLRRAFPPSVPSTTTDSC